MSKMSKWTGLFSSKWTGLKFVKFSERKIIVWISGEKEVRRCGKLGNLERKRKKISKWTGLFSVNGLGLNFCGIFEEKNYRSDFGKIFFGQKQ